MCVPQFRNYLELPGITRPVGIFGTLVGPDRNPIIKHLSKNWDLLGLNPLAQQAPALILELSNSKCATT